LLREFAPGGQGGNNSGRWYTDDELADIIGDDWFEDFDVSNDGFNIDAYGEKAKQNLVDYANHWFDDRGYNVNVLGVEHNDVDHDLKWYIVGSFYNPGFANKGVAEGKVINTYLWHGSRQKIPMLEPRQSVDTGGAAGSNQNAIYATSDPKVAIAMGLTTPGSDTGMFPNDPQMVLFSGKIRKGEYVYLHKLPFNGPDGKPQFVQGGNSREFHSIPGVEGIKPIEIKEIPVNKYLNLIRKATPADLKLRKKYMKKQGVAEGLEQQLVTIYTNPAYKGATVDDRIKKSLPVTEAPFNKLQMWENGKSMKDPKVAQWVNNNLLPQLKQNGKLGPLVVWNNKGKLFVIDGNHRFIAYQAAGYNGNVPVQIVPDKMINIVDTVPGQQGVAEGSEKKDNLIWTLNSFGYYSDNSSVYVNDDGDKIVRVGSEWKHQSGKRGRGPEELGNFLSSLQDVSEGFGLPMPGTYEQEHGTRTPSRKQHISAMTYENDMSKTSDYIDEK
jgi:hypothetical protein